LQLSEILSLYYCCASVRFMFVMNYKRLRSAPILNVLTVVFFSYSRCFLPAQRAVPGPAAAPAISYHLPLNTTMRMTKLTGWPSIVAAYPMELSKLMFQHHYEKNHDFLRRSGKHLLVCVLSYFVTDWFQFKCE
jgi:hypothetical protein